MNSSHQSHQNTAGGASQYIPVVNVPVNDSMAPQNITPPHHQDSTAPNDPGQADSLVSDTVQPSPTAVTGTTGKGRLPKKAGPIAMPTPIVIPAFQPDPELDSPAAYREYLAKMKITGCKRLDATDDDSTDGAEADESEPDEDTQNVMALKNEWIGKIYDVILHSSLTLPTYVAQLSAEVYEEYRRQQAWALGFINSKMMDEDGQKSAQCQVGLLYDAAVNVHIYGVKPDVMADVMSLKSKRSVPAVTKCAVEWRLTCTQRMERIVEAVKYHKRIALDVLNGTDLDALAMNPQGRLKGKLDYKGSNLRRQKNAEAVRQMQSEAAAEASAVDAQEVPQAPVKKTPSRSTKRKRAVDLNEEVTTQSDTENSPRAKKRPRTKNVNSTPLDDSEGSSMSPPMNLTAPSLGMQHPTAPLYDAQAGASLTPGQNQQVPYAQQLEHIHQVPRTQRVPHTQQMLHNQEVFHAQQTATHLGTVNAITPPGRSGSRLDRLAAPDTTSHSFGTHENMIDPILHGYSNTAANEHPSTPLLNTYHQARQSTSSLNHPHGYRFNAPANHQAQQTPSSAITTPGHDFSLERPQQASSTLSDLEALQRNFELDQNVPLSDELLNEFIYYNSAGDGQEQGAGGQIEDYDFS